MIIKNDKMESILEMFNIYNKPEYFSPKLSQLINPVFLELNECILLKQNEGSRSINVDYIISAFGDRTGFEAFDSHIHLIDYIDEFRFGIIEGLRFFLQLSILWGTKLKDTFPQYKFHIVLFYNGDNCILRFHRLRDNESPWVDINSINDYTKEALLVNVINDNR